MIRGTIVAERAVGTRTCKCGKKIRKGEWQIAVYFRNGSWTPMRENYCKDRCAYKHLAKIKLAADRMERTLYGEDG